MKAKKIIISGIVLWIVNTIFIWLTCGWLFTWVYEIEPIIWLTPEVMMSTSNMIWSNIIALGAAILFTLVYAILYKGIPNKGVKKGLTYGFLFWLVGPLTGIIGMPFYMTISTTVVIYWLIQLFIISLVKGAIVGAIYKK